MENFNETEFGFIPKPLIVDGRPELSVFPLNVLFGQGRPHPHFGWHGLEQYQTALYLPDLSSYAENDGLASMCYYNQHNRDFWLKISYRQSENGYCGEKFFGFKKLSMSVGFEWKQFFIHLTMVGLAEGEGG